MASEIGKITKWNDEKGFGFITPKSGGKSVFVHINDFSKKHKQPVEGLSVIFSLSKDSRGRICATDVSPERGHKRVTKADKQKMAAIIISCTFLILVAGLVLLNKLPPIILGFYIVVSVITFGLYAQDKSAAKKGNWRTSETTLHLFSLFGGWPGAAVAQSQLRHKSKKVSFRVKYWLTVVINCGVLGWLLTPKGTHELQLIISSFKEMYLG